MVAVVVVVRRARSSVEWRVSNQRAKREKTDEGGRLTTTFNAWLPHLRVIIFPPFGTLLVAIVVRHGFWGKRASILTA